jgi:ataxia telangiectasia mutated family protein
MSGNAYDVQVVFRLCQLFFSLGSDPEVVKHMGVISQEVPSYKFLPLAYQLASRLNRPGRNLALDSGGFTVRLGVWDAYCQSPL